MGCIFSLIATGLALIWGVVEIVNFAHGSFMMLSMYVAYFTFTLLGVDPIVSIPLCAAVLFLWGAASYKTIITRLMKGKLLMQIFGTFGLMMAMDYGAMALWSPNYRSLEGTWFSGEIEIGGYFFGEGQLVASVVSLIVLGLVTVFLLYTKTGKGLRASADDKIAAVTVGIDSEKMYTYAWGIGSACVGVAGALMTNFFYVQPQVGMVFTFFAFVCVALAGFGRIKGILVAGIMVGVIRSLSGFLIEPWTKDVTIFIIFIVILLLRPQGLFMGK
jgi:branched-chain amino acid transport system permease protein